MVKEEVIADIIVSLKEEGDVDVATVRQVLAAIEDKMKFDEDFDGFEDLGRLQPEPGPPNTIQPPQALCFPAVNSKEDLAEELAASLKKQAQKVVENYMVFIFNLFSDKLAETTLVPKISNQIKKTFPAFPEDLLKDVITSSFKLIPDLLRKKAVGPKLEKMAIDLSSKGAAKAAKPEGLNPKECQEIYKSVIELTRDMFYMYCRKPGVKESIVQDLANMMKVYAAKK